jgi:hypothetical protein
MTHVESFKRPPQAYARGCSSSLRNMTVQGDWCMAGRRHVPFGGTRVFHAALADRSSRMLQNVTIKSTDSEYEKTMICACSHEPHY